ncbi:MAG TPA: AraC family transcriptional regulator [Terriglobales bacterium]|nr:AraC family transcriptional regulator [Terriglobales bacterium]
MPGRRFDLLERLRVAHFFAGIPVNFAESPLDTMDAFSEILSGVKLNGALFFNAEFSVPWGFSVPASKQMSVASTLAPAAAHFLLYHLVVDGSAVVEMADGKVLELHSGDIVIFPNGDAHHMSSKGAKRPFPNYGINDKIKARDLSPLRAGGGGETSRFVCGYMTCDPHIGRPILNGLPPVFKVNIRTDRSGQWLESSILHLVEEAISGHVGSEAMLAKLSEALFVDTLRRYVAGLPEDQKGWLTGARDPIVGKSLGLMHRRIAHPWTIASLADEVGISRSALVERFTRYLSEPPMAYLTRWRLQLAARSLERTSRGVAEIASDVGYESEAAFNRAFKREFGRPPGRYRSDHKAHLVTRPINGQRQDKSAFSGTGRAAPALTIRKSRESI